MTQNRLFIVEKGGQRLDLYLASQFDSEGLTRSRLQQLIRAGMVLVNGSALKAKYLLQVGDRLTVTIPPGTPSELVAEPVEFVTLHEDDDLIVLVKPPGVVVHPASGHSTATLVHGLLYHCGGLSGMNGELRPGIVHRLDKDTSGIMVVAKTDFAHQALADQFKRREVKKIYQALVDGSPISQSGRVDLPIGRHPVHRKKMAIREDGREAVTNWRVLERFAQGLTLLELGLETGRTHQIRVHMAALSHPVAGDSVYGRKNSHYLEMGITRQCLHAHTLAFRHPRTGENLQFTAPLWGDILNTLELLRRTGGL
ncbi:MAG: RluA family pseudouridine synthase [Desulfobulbaceae bacterium]|nr:RluA family pseudouridine synthase [Desulfobulbaceae bacterium]HIJ91251.1 RluA family pseudouridine synthase [Deltaproteobacteria bacterium]